MKPIRIIYLVLFVAAVVVWGIYFFRNYSPETWSEPSITKVSVKNKILNIGEVKRHNAGIGRFELVNEGIYPLVIENVETDCSCTVSDYEKRPIGVGASTFIELTYDSHSLGYFQKKAYVKCNSEEKTIVLVLRGNVVE